MAIIRKGPNLSKNVVSNTLSFLALKYPYILIELWDLFFCSFVLHLPSIYVDIVWFLSC